MPGKFCVYAHHKETDGSVFYIGKGDKKRAHAIARRSEYWHRIYRKHGRSVRIIADNLSEECAFSMERALIAYIGRDNLANMTDGGEGTSGRVPSKDQRDKCSASNKGVQPSRETIAAAVARNSKPVGTECGLVFNSASDAARFVMPNNYRVALSAISACCNGYRVDSAYGYKFRYIVDGVLSESGFKRKPHGVPVKTECGLSFSSAQEAANWLKSNGHPKAINSNIIQNCKGRVMSAYGYSWRYA